MIDEVFNRKWLLIRWALVIQNSVSKILVFNNSMFDQIEFSRIEK